MIPSSMRGEPTLGEDLPEDIMKTNNGLVSPSSNSQKFNGKIERLMPIKYWMTK
jgi:hypothetical protein